MINAGRKMLQGGAMRLGRMGRQKGVNPATGKAGWGKNYKNPKQVRASGYRRMGAVGGGAVGGGMMLSSRGSSARKGQPSPRSSGGVGYPPGHSMGGRM